jgi:hypothetical protein
MQALVDKHEEEAARMRKAGAQARRDEREDRLVLNRYLGVENCRGCHVSQYEQWRKTAHARSYETLVVQRKTEEKECVSCHVTGFGEPTGFTAELEGPDLGNVGCETCHGMGTEHARGEGAVQITETMCLSCHDAQNSPDFEYAEYLKAVVH